LNDNVQAGVATYVLIMFGMVFILYLFGFTNMWSAYQIQSMNSSGGTPITNSAENFGFNVIDMIVRALMNQNNWGLLAGGVLGGLFILIVGKLTNTLGVILTFLIPVVILIALNIFVFPLSGLSEDVGFMDASGAVITGGLFAFFNIFFILSIVEYIRGNI
jgi:hypothetical protein